MGFWEKIKRDLGKEVRTGVEAIKSGATAIRETAEELTEEGKRRYRMYELRSKARNWMTELGGRVYELSAKDKNPMVDMKVRLMVSRIRKLEGQIERLEGKTKLHPSKKGER